MPNYLEFEFIPSSKKKGKKGENMRDIFSPNHYKVPLPGFWRRPRAAGNECPAWPECRGAPVRARRTAGFRGSRRPHRPC